MKIRRVKKESSSQKTLKRFASDVFKESSLSAIIGILIARSRPQKMFKTFVLLISLAGFFYQSASFLSYVLKYPTVVGINIAVPVELELPAFTFCNNNGISRSKFCSKYPTRCTVADLKMCSKYSSSCKVNETLIPKSKYYSLENNIDVEDFLDLTQDLNSSLYDLWSDYSNKSFYPNYHGPIMRPKTLLKDGLGRVGCFSIHSLVESEDTPIREVINRDRLGFPIFVFFFNVQEEEEFLPNHKSGMLFEIHSPYLVVNPTQTGIFMTPGRTYRIHVKMSIETLLPYPYDTDCINYTDLWMSRNKSGPRLQEMCVQDCLLKIFDKFWNCTPVYILYSNAKHVCTRDELASDLPYVDDEMENCFQVCKKDCSKMTYNQVVQERFTEDFKLLENPVIKEDKLIVVEVFFDKSQIIMYEHRAQYLDIEVFSYIGGFLGIWLGISLIELSDFFETLFRIAYFYFKRRIIVSHIYFKSNIECIKTYQK